MEEKSSNFPLPYKPHMGEIPWKEPKNLTERRAVDLEPLGSQSCVKLGKTQYGGVGPDRNSEDMLLRHWTQLIAYGAWYSRLEIQATT